MSQALIQFILRVDYCGWLVLYIRVRLGCIGKSSVQTQLVKYRRSRCCNLAATLVRTPKLARCDDLQLPCFGRIEVFGGWQQGTGGGDKRNQVECLARAQYIICSYPLPVDSLAHLRGSEFLGGFDEEECYFFDITF